MMTRQMADAISANYGSLPADAALMRAGYVTGTPDIQWTQVQLATATVTIDQGYQSPVPTTATVRDVEQGAWPIDSFTVSTATWTAARPTIYISRAALPAIESLGWQGDVWLADWTGTPPPAPPPMPAGMTCVAVQYASLAAYDLSVVFDPTWPDQENRMPLLIRDPSDGATYLLDGGKMHHIGAAADLGAYSAVLGQPVNVSTAEITALLADFPPGQPQVTVGTVVTPPYTITMTGTATPAAGG